MNRTQKKLCHHLWNALWLFRNGLPILWSFYRRRQTDFWVVLNNNCYSRWAEFIGMATSIFTIICNTFGCTHSIEDPQKDMCLWRHKTASKIISNKTSFVVRPKKEHKLWRWALYVDQTTYIIKFHCFKVSVVQICGWKILRLKWFLTEASSVVDWVVGTTLWQRHWLHWFKCNQKRYARRKHTSTIRTHKQTQHPMRYTKL